VSLLLSFSHHHFERAPVLPFHSDTIFGAAGIRCIHRLSDTINPLSFSSSVCYKARPEEKLVQILWFFMFVVMVIFFTLALGYGLSLLENKAISQMSDASRDVLQEEAPKAEGEMQT